MTKLNSFLERRGSEFRPYEKEIYLVVAFLIAALGVWVLFHGLDAT